MHTRTPVRRPLLALASLLVLALHQVSAAAIDADDIAGIAAVTFGADPAALLDALATPPPNRRLPDGFTNPVDDEPRYPDLVDDVAPDFGGMPHLVGTATLPFDTDRDVIGGALSAGVLTFVVATIEITSTDLDSLANAVTAGFEQDPVPGTTTDVNQLTVEGTDTLVVTIASEDDGAEAVIQHVVMPVGNTLVIGTVIVADERAVRERPVRRHAETLLLAGVDHLGRVAEDVPKRDPINVL